MPFKSPDGTIKVLNRLTGKSYDLNPAAAYLTTLSDGSRDLDEIVSEFSRAVDVGLEEAREVALYYLSSLEESRQLVWRSSKVERVSVPAPDYLILELTNRCNLNCIHCSVSANERPGEELSTDEWKAVIKSISDMGVRAVGLSGGEPLLRRDFFEIASHAVDLGLLVGLVTNGLLIDEGNIGEIRRLNLDVQVSLDGSKPFFHDKIRGKEGSFERLQPKLELLAGNGVGFTIAAVATAVNYREVPRLLELAEEIGAKSFRVQPFFPVGRGRLHREELDLTPSMTREVTSFFVEETGKHEIDMGGFYFQFALDPDFRPSEQSCEDGSCSAGRGFGGITHDGYVYPCSHIWHISEDNVRERPLPWIWENSRIFNFFRSLRREDVSPVCQGCIYFSKCKGGCKAMNILDGRFREPDSHCWIAAGPRGE
jgi:radical SAM protein with 4Fe4S-binding SPASM domain